MTLPQHPRDCECRRCGPLHPAHRRAIRAQAWRHILFWLVVVWLFIARAAAALVWGW